MDGSKRQAWRVSNIRDIEDGAEERREVGHENPSTNVPRLHQHRCTPRSQGVFWRREECNDDPCRVLSTLGRRPRRCSFRDKAPFLLENARLEAATHSPVGAGDGAGVLPIPEVEA